MATITIASQSTEFEWEGRTAPRLRVYAKVPFLTAAGVPVHAGSQYGGRAYRDLACSFVDPDTDRRVVTPEFTLPSTTDSIDKPDTAEYIAFLYSRGADVSSQYQEFSVFSSGFKLDHTDASTDWEAIRAFNLGTLPTATPHDASITGSLDVGEDITAGGTITAGPGGFVGPGGNLTGVLGVGTGGGSSSTGSLSHVVDSDNTNAGEIYSLLFGSGGSQTESLRASRTEITAQLPLRLKGYATGSLPSGLTRQLAYDSDRNLPVYHNGTAWLPVGGGMSVFNVLEKGADPTGTADSTSAIQDAIDACTAAGGGIVYFPPGDYKVTGLTVGIFSNVLLVGAGWVSRIRMNSATGDTIDFTGDSSNFGLMRGCGLRDLKLEPLVTRTSGYEISAKYFQSFILHNLCVFTDGGGINLGGTAGDSVYADVSGVFIGGNPTECLKLTRMLDGNFRYIFAGTGAATSNMIVLDGRVEGCVFQGIDLFNGAATPAGASVLIYAVDYTASPARFNKFTDCYFDSHAVGLNAIDGVDNRFRGCWISARVFAGAVLETATKNYSFEDCDILNIGSNGIQLNGVGHSVKGNDIGALGNVSAGAGGVVVDAAASYFQIVNNTFTNLSLADWTSGGSTPFNMADAVRIAAGADHFIVMGNTFRALSAPVTNGAGTGATKIVTNNVQ